MLQRTQNQLKKAVKNLSEQNNGYMFGSTECIESNFSKRINWRFYACWFQNFEQ